MIDGLQISSEEGVRRLRVSITAIHRLGLKVTIWVALEKKSTMKSYRMKSKGSAGNI
ncbi:MAG: hypothetical protein LBD61_03425 [Endomicrobium sp.]|nr:hypothetical protein [Endomicrobium sp.]